MKKSKGYRKIPLTFNRRMVDISASVTAEKSTIHNLTEVDISKARKQIRDYKKETGESLSFTAYIVYCLAQTIAKDPGINVFRKGNQLVLLDDVTISVLIEREFKGEKVPEPLGIQQAQKKSYLQIHKEIRKAQGNQGEQLGSLSNFTWVRYIPKFLLKTFVRLASRNIKMQMRYGVASVTAVGMFGKSASWFIPHGTATVLLTVGSIVERPVLSGEKYENREHLCLTISFDHALVDGAPAARFVTALCEELSGAHALKELTEDL